MSTWTLLKDVEVHVRVEGTRAQRSTRNVNQSLRTFGYRVGQFNPCL